MPTLSYPDTVCGLACEDRDLAREARDLDACAGAMLALMAELYPDQCLTN